MGNCIGKKKSILDMQRNKSLTSALYVKLS